MHSSNDIEQVEMIQTVANDKQLMLCTSNSSELHSEFIKKYIYLRCIQVILVLH